MERLGRFRYYLFSATLSLGILIAIGSTHPLSVLLTTVILAILEITFSFDNAVVNAAVLQRMSAFWQFVFLSVGIVIAVGVVRFLLPIGIVMGTAGLGFGSVLSLALNHPHQYAQQLDAAHVQVAMVGGVFLLMIFLNWVFGEKDPCWIGPLERPLQKFGRFGWLAPLITLVVIAGISASENWKSSVWICGLVSLGVYLVMDWVGNQLEDEDEDDVPGPDAPAKAGKSGLAGLVLFGYLEFQDAAFSLDGVSGAFAISTDVVVIAAGLCIGALFVRAMTVDLVHSGTLAELRYLEHGAHWAIGTLATFILVSTHVEIPSYVTGLIGVVFIAAALFGSIRANKRDKLAGACEVSSTIPVVTPASAQPAPPLH